MSPPFVALCMLFFPTLLSVQGSLFGSWGNPFTAVPLTITQIDPLTGEKGPVLFTESSQYAQMFSISPAVDENTLTIYLPLLNQAGSAQQDPKGTWPAVLRGYRFANGNFTVVSSTPLPYGNVMVTQFDQKSGRIYCLSAPLQDSFLQRSAENRFTAQPVMFFGYVDPVAQKYYAISQLSIAPAVAGLGGVAAALFSPGGVLLVSTMTPQNGTVPPQPAISLVSLTTGAIKHTSILNRIPEALAIKTRTRNVYGLFSSLTSPFNMTVGVVDRTTGTPHYLPTWPNKDLVFVVGALSAIDANTNVLYSLMGSGEGPPVALVTVDLHQGNILRYKYFGQHQPHSLWQL